MTPADGAVLAGSYDHFVIVLSVLIAVLASYAALDLAERVTVARGGTRLAWLISGATAMGIGIWSMHYTGMLAFRLPVPVLYYWPMVLVSLLAGVLSSAVALFVVSRREMGFGWAFAGSTFQGGGIAVLHYTGMASMRLPAMCHYSPAIVALSVLLAIAGSLLSLWLAFLFRDEETHQTWLKGASAVLMGAAISVMHYTGMAAASFTQSSAVPDRSHAVSISSLGTVAIGIVAAMVLVVALLTSLADRLQKQKALLDELFEQAPEAVILMDLDYRVVRVNREFTRLFGYTPEQALDRGLSELIVPDEARDEFQRYADRIAHGQRVDAEGVRRRKDGTRVHVSIMHVPVAVPGARIAIYAIYRDITERKAAAAALHKLSGRLLRLQDEERRRLARELHDSTAQLLAGLAINLSVVNESAGALEPRARRVLDESRTLTGRCLKDIRTVSYLLHPPELDELGLQSALASYVDGFAQRSGIQVDLEVAPNLGRLPQEVETALFRVVQEALANIHRHSGQQHGEYSAGSRPN